MQDFDLKFYLSLFWRRFPLFLFVWALISGLGVLVALFLPETYRSTASILVESEQIDGSTVNLSANEQIQVVEQRMMTRQNLLDIADEFGVFAGRADLSPSQRVEAMEEATEFESMDFGRESRNDKNAIAFTVSFSTGSGPLAAGVTNKLVTEILELNANIRGDLAESNREFFEQEVARLNRELTVLETELSNFKTENQTSLPELLEFNQEQLIALKENLTRLENEERELNDQRNAMLRVIENPDLIEIERAELSPDELELSRLETERATLRATFSANHPKVRAIDTQLKLVKARLGGGTTNGGGDLVAQRVSKMKLALEQLDRRFLILREQRDEVLAEITELEAAVTKSPKVEAQLNVMNREYSGLQKEYAARREALAEAKTGEVIEDTGKGERFSVIERANVPDESEGPGKLLIAAGGIAGGFFASFGLVMLLELLNRSIRRPADLISGLGIQPFATIPYIMTTRDVRRKRFSILLIALLIAIAVPALLLSIHYYYQPLDYLLGRVAEEMGIDALKTIFPTMR